MRFRAKIGGADVTPTATQHGKESRKRGAAQNLALMRRYFALLYTKELHAVLDLVDDDIEWVIIPTGDIIRGKADFAKLAESHWGA
jgi:ketosteroid isomerase-like protein